MGRRRSAANLPVKREPGEQKALANLSSAQERLLETLREPKFKDLGVDELCKQAVISRASFYLAFHDQNFLNHLESEMAAYRSANDFAVMHNLVAQAKEGKSDRMMAIYQRLQGRLREGGEKPAQVILVFGNVERPPKIIEGEVVKDADSG